MSRPHKFRFCRCRPSACYFKPRGIPLRLLQETILFPDEIEALKLHDLDGLTHHLAAKAMKISQPTFTRILNRAYHKVALALLSGRAIKLDIPTDSLPASSYS